MYLGDNMIYLYKDLTKLGKNDFNIKKMVEKKELYMIKKGIYSTTEDFNYLELLSKKHPNIIFTLQTACYCYGLLKQNNVPYYIVTKQKDRKIKDENVKQIFMTDELYSIGMNHVKYLGFDIQIYDLERLLIEVVRNKKNIDFDTYLEIMQGYKKIIKLLNKNKINQYIIYFKDPKILYRLEHELFN